MVSGAVVELEEEFKIIKAAMKSVVQGKNIRCMENYFMLPKVLP